MPNETAHTGPMPRSWRQRLWLPTAAIFACLAFVYFQPSIGATGRAVAWLTMDVVTVGIIVAGILVVRPDRPLAWLMLAAGVACIGAGDAAWYGILMRDGVAPELSIADVFYLAEYPFLLVG